MTESALNDLERRLVALEHSNRRWRGLAMGALALGVALPWTLGFSVAAGAAGDQDPAAAADAAAPAAVDELRAHRVVVVDANGTERMILDGGKDQGIARFVIRDPAQHDRIDMGADHLTGHIVLSDLNEKQRLGLAVDAHPHLMLQDVHGKPRAHMAVGITGAPSLLMFDDDGVFPAGIGVHKDGTPWLLPGLPPPTAQTKPAPGTGEGNDDGNTVGPTRPDRDRR